jgi:hypothetical protein
MDRYIPEAAFSIARVLGLLIAALTLGGLVASARADAIGPCGPGERVVMNATAPGAMHHGGFHCEPTSAPPPSASPPPATSASASSTSGLCGVAHDAPSAWLPVSIGLAALVLSRRRARVT